MTLSVTELEEELREQEQQFQEILTDAQAELANVQKKLKALGEYRALQTKLEELRTAQGKVQNELNEKELEYQRVQNNISNLKAQLDGAASPALVTAPLISLEEEPPPVVTTLEPDHVVQVVPTPVIVPQAVEPDPVMPVPEAVASVTPEPPVIRLTVSDLETLRLRADDNSDGGELIESALHALGEEKPAKACLKFAKLTVKEPDYALGWLGLAATTNDPIQASAAWTRYQQLSQPVPVQAVEAWDGGNEFLWGGDIAEVIPEFEHVKNGKVLLPNS